MKFKKPNTETSKKTKASLSDKTKFKSKDAAVPIVKLQKNTKQSANLIKQMVNDKEFNLTVKTELTGSASKKSKKKKTNKPGELSPEVQMGLKLDRLIEQKIKEQSINAGESPPSPKVKNVKPLKETTNSSSSLSESSPKANKKRKKGKKKGNNENKSTQSVPRQNLNNGDSPEKLSPNKKQAKKRKNENVVQSSDSTDEPTKVVVKRKKKKGKGKQQSVSASENEDPKQEEAGDLPGEPFTLNSKDVLKAVKSSIDQFKKVSKSSKKLLDSEPDPLFLHFNFFYPHNKQKIIRFELCSSLVTSTSDVCLFVADLAKKNADESKAQWEKMFQDEKVTGISEVIPLRSLATDYIQFEDKRKLSDRFDFFLVDGKICHRVYKLLGSKFFHSKRKTPTPVTLKKGKMAEYITKGLAKTVAQYTPAADSFSIQVGHTGMEERDIMMNILKVWEQYPQQFGVYWENIEKASVFSPQTPKLPIFMSVSPPKGKPREYKNMKWSKDDSPVQGELSTAMDKSVLVYPGGRVVMENLPLERSAEAKAKRREKNKEKKLLKMKKKSKSEGDSDEGEEGDKELDSDDDLGGRADMLESETDEEDEPPIKKPAGKQDVKKNVVPEKKSKGKQVVATKKGQESDSDIVDKAEASYLRDLAAEKKGKVKTQAKGKGGKQQKSNSQDSDSDDGEDNDSDDSSHPEDDDIEDSLDDLDDFSKEEDSDSNDEEEQVVKKPAGKPKTMKINNKGNKKINGAPPQTNSKSQRQMAQKKSGAVKSPRNKKGKKKQDSSQSSSSESSPNKKKASVPSFQGTQANQKQKKNKNQQAVKNKKVARKLTK